MAGRVAAECLAVRVRMLSRCVTAVYDAALRPLGVRASQMNVLVAVAVMESASPSEVAKQLLMDKSTLTRDLERLKAAGWIETRPGDDGRQQRLSVTAKGLRLLERTESAWLGAQGEVRSLLGADGAETIRRTANRLAGWSA